MYTDMLIWAVLQLLLAGGYRQIFIGDLEKFQKNHIGLTTSRQPIVKFFLGDLEKFCKYS